MADLFALALAPNEPFCLDCCPPFAVGAGPATVRSSGTVLWTALRAMRVSFWDCTGGLLTLGASGDAWEDRGGRLEVLVMDRAAVDHGHGHGHGHSHGHGHACMCTHAHGQGRGRNHGQDRMLGQTCRRRAGRGGANSAAGGAKEERQTRPPCHSARRGGAPTAPPPGAASPGHIGSGARGKRAHHALPVATLEGERRARRAPSVAVPSRERRRSAPPPAPSPSPRGSSHPPSRGRAHVAPSS